MLRYFGILTIACLGLLAGGCATSAMKATPFHCGPSRAASPEDAGRRVNLWPLAFWQQPTLSVCWPIYESSDTHFALRPFHSRYRTHGPKADYDEFNWLYPLSHFAPDGGLSWVFPLAWGDGYSGIWPFFHATDDFIAVFPFYWQSVGRKHETFSSLLPLYWFNSRDDGRRVTAWAAAGLVGLRSEDDEITASWVLPFYLRSGDLRMKLLVRGETAEADWLFPLWYRDEETFLTLPWYHRFNRATGEDTSAALLGLAGWRTKDEAYRASWFYPFYAHEAGRSLWTPLYSDSLRIENGLPQRRRWWLFMLAGREDGRRRGSWAFPFYSRSERGDFDRAAALMDVSRLPDEIDLSRRPIAKAGTFADDCGGSRRRRYLFLFDNDRFASGWRLGGAHSNDYQIVRHDKIGNALIANYDCRRTATFDARRREKTGESEVSTFSLGWFLFDHRRERDSASGRDYLRDRLLWRFWHYERLNGSSSLDFFPGFSWDSRRDGSCRVAFLWRLFRYERKAGRKADVDFLFIPVWRGGAEEDR